MTKSFGVAAGLIAGVAMGSAGTNVMPVFIDDFASRAGLSGAGAGLVGAAQLTATAVVTLLLAARAASPGRVAMARLGLLLTAFGALWVALADDPVTLLLTNLLLGAALGIVYAAATAALAATEDTDRASAVAVAGTVVVAALMIVAVPLVNEHWGGAGFLLLAVCCVPAWFLVSRLPESPAIATEAAVGSGSVVGNLPADLVTATKAAAGRPSAVLLLGTALLWTITQGTWAYASVLGREHTGLDATAVSLILAVSSVVALAGAVAGTPAARRFGRLRSMVVFVVVEAVAMAVVVISDEPVLFTVAAVVWQACQLAVLVQMVAAAAVLDPSGRWVASLSGASALGTGAGPLAVGLLLEHTGPEVLGVVFALGMVVASLPLLRMTTAADSRLAAGVPIPAGDASSR